MYVDVPADQAEQLLPERDEDGKVTRHPDYLDVCEAASAYKAMTGGEHHYAESWVSIEEAAGDEPDGFASVLDGSGPRRLLWTARAKVIDARRWLGEARYREGHCPTVDAINGDLARIEDRIRLEALAAEQPPDNTGSGAEPPPSSMRRSAPAGGVDRG